MTKNFLLIVFIFAYLIVMTKSISAIEYRILDNHNTTITKSYKIEKISKTIERCASFFKITKRDIKEVTSTQDGKILLEKITDLKISPVHTHARIMSIQLIFQLLIAIIAIVFIVLLVIGTIFSVVIGSLISFLFVILISIIITLIKIIIINKC